MMCMSESTNRRPSFMSSSCGVTERAGSPLRSAVARTIAGACTESSAAMVGCRRPSAPSRRRTPTAYRRAQEANRMTPNATLARAILVTALLVATAPPSRAAEPAGEVTVSFHVTLAPAWFDPSTAPPQITPFGVMYAIHDALVRPLPGQKMGASLAESWTESRDGLVYEFRLRRGLRFHNGDPITAEDVKFSFDRYNGAGARELRARVRQLD